jgi:hypothetical protein
MSGARARELGCGAAVHRRAHVVRRCPDDRGLARSRRESRRVQQRADERPRGHRRGQSTPWHWYVSSTRCDAAGVRSQSGRTSSSVGAHGSTPLLPLLTDFPAGVARRRNSGPSQVARRVPRTPWPRVPRGGHRLAGAPSSATTTVVVSGSPRSRPPPTDEQVTWRSAVCTTSSHTTMTRSTIASCSQPWPLAYPTSCTISDCRRASTIRQAPGR